MDPGSAMHQVNDLTRQMNNMQSELDNLHREERDTEKSIHDEVQRINVEKNAKRAVMAAASASDNRNNTGLHRAEMLRQELDLVNEETEKKKQADNKIREIRQKATDLAAQIESTKREIVKYQARTGL